MADEIANLVVKIKVKIEVEDDTYTCKKTREVENQMKSQPLSDKLKT